MCLRGYDYSRPGIYFITIVVQNRLHMFGNVINGKMVLNHDNQRIYSWCEKTPMETIRW